MLKHLFLNIQFIILQIYLCSAVIDQSNYIVKAPAIEAYQPTWESLDKRPLPLWFDRAKVGIFVHWGVYSVPSFGSEWFWENWRAKNSESYVSFMNKNYRPGFTYQEFAKDFTAEHFNALEWAKLFEESGAR